MPTPRFTIVSAPIESRVYESILKNAKSAGEMGSTFRDALNETVYETASNATTRVLKAAYEVTAPHTLLHFMIVVFCLMYVAKLALVKRRVNELLSGHEQAFCCREKTD